MSIKVDQANAFEAVIQWWFAGHILVIYWWYTRDILPVHSPFLAVCHHSLAQKPAEFGSFCRISGYKRKKVRELALPDFAKLLDIAAPVYVRAAGFLAAWSRIVSSTLLGTCAKVNGSIEYEARHFESERMAVA